jgi:Cd2+/Zn2+-exporting ATPase
MAAARPTDCEFEGAKTGCLARSILETFAQEPTLEAVTVDPARQTVSVATLGHADLDRLRTLLGESLQRARENHPTGQCAMLGGGGDCSGCAMPLPATELRRFTIAHEDRITKVSRVTCPTAPKFWRWRDIPFPKFVQREVELVEAGEHIGEWKWQLLCAFLCAAFGIAAYALTTHGAKPGLLGYALYALAYLAGSWFAAEELWERLRKEGGLDVHFLMLAVAAGSAAVNEWNEGVILLFLFSFAGALEHYATERTQREIRSLFRDAPKVATLVDARGNEREMAVEKIRGGMRLLVKPGSQFPVDAEIVKGQTAADESNLTGEAAPVEKTVGDRVLAGTINVWGAVEVAALRPASESSLQKIIRLIKEAQRQKAPAQRFTDKFSAIYTYAVIAASFGMFFVWWLGLGLAPFTSPDPDQPGLSAFYRTMTLLVVSSPCALVLSIPSAVLAAIAWGARHGILIRGGAAVEKLAEVNVVALDKTGTLTTGELRVEKVESFPAGQEGEIARLAYSLERLSTHPLARAITRYGKQKNLEAIELTQFESITGQGLRAQRGKALCLLGRREWVAEATSPQTVAAVPPTEAGCSEVWLSEGALLGRIILRDDVRPQSRLVVDELRGEGLRSVVLTGDRKAAADHLQAELNLDEVRAELKPEDKVAAIKSLGESGRRVAMVGDGVNDAPSLAVAHVGVAMGARGSDAALEQADVVLMHDRLENVLAAFRLSQRARRIIRQNLFISLGTVAVLVVFATLGKMPLPVGVIGHEGSTVIVVMNSLRLLLGGAKRSGPPAAAITAA